MHYIHKRVAAYVGALCLSVVAVVGLSASPAQASVGISHVMGGGPFQDDVVAQVNVTYGSGVWTMDLNRQMCFSNPGHPNGVWVIVGVVGVTSTYLGNQSCNDAWKTLPGSNPMIGTSYSNSKRVYWEFNDGQPGGCHRIYIAPGYSPGNQESEGPC